MATYEPMEKLKHALNKSKSGNQMIPDAVFVQWQ